ncbi:MAG: signal peptidase I, partial [Candidatus Aminicenantes bacterium]|nr:signal peptidase I [Candidatus Aminicenantes bacterium]
PDMEKEYVKRVIGLPGDRLRIRGRRVFINGRPLAEPYTVFRNEGNGADFPPRYSYDWYFQFPLPLRRTQPDAAGNVDYVVPPRHYFCMGDNRDNSFDSRFWGPVPFEYVVGKPWRIYWSYESSTEEYLTPGLIYKIKDIALTIVRFFSHTRWERTIKSIE